MITAGAVKISQQRHQSRTRVLRNKTGLAFQHVASSAAAQFVKLGGVIMVGRPGIIIPEKRNKPPVAMIKHHTLRAVQVPAVGAATVFVKISGIIMSSLFGVVVAV